jgi:hypothetical protein
MSVFVTISGLVLSKTTNENKGSSVLNLKVGTRIGKSKDNQTYTTYDVEYWGKHGEAIAPLIRANDKKKEIVGTNVTVYGELIEEAVNEGKNGKQYINKKLRASKIDPMGNLAPKDGDDDDDDDEEDNELEDEDLKTSKKSSKSTKSTKSSKSSTKKSKVEDDNDDEEEF